MLYKIAFILALSVCQAKAQQTSDFSLTKEETQTHASALVSEWKDSLREALADVVERQCLTIGNMTMPLHWQLFDEEPSDGRSLYISLHGGGGAPKEVNDQQWRNQWRLYQPANSVYLCPRAPVDAWNMHFQSEFDAFYQKIIQLGVVFFHVNPNKVYLMGYSAGGDGVWRIAPRMADSWAAASMMAGHPGDVSLVNLRNTPFMIWCGEQDAAYDRNIRCQERIHELDSLHQADNQGYQFEGHIVKGMGHWMNLEDKAALSWMAQYRRNPYPNKIVWRQEEVVRQHFYWITAPANELKRGKEVRIELLKTSKGIPSNTIHITHCDYSALILSFNDKMLDLDKSIKVVYQGKTLFKGKVKRSAATLRKTLYERGDSEYMFPVQIHLSIK